MKLNFKYLFFVFLALFIATLALWLYQSSDILKKEYETICRQNYGDPLTLGRCMQTYDRHRNFYKNATLLTGGLAIFTFIWWKREK